MRFPRRESGEESAYAPYEESAYASYPDPAADAVLPADAVQPVHPQPTSPAYPQPAPATPAHPRVASSPPPVPTQPVPVQTRPELSPEQAEARGSVIGSLLIGAVALVAGAAAGIALFAALTTKPITQDLPGTVVFAAFGAALPFGWRATRLRNSSLTLPLLIWPIAIVLRAWFSIIIGAPAFAFYLIRNLWLLHRIKRL